MRIARQANALVKYPQHRQYLRLKCNIIREWSKCREYRHPSLVSRDGVVPCLRETSRGQRSDHIQCDRQDVDNDEEDRVERHGCDLIPLESVHSDELVHVEVVSDCLSYHGFCQFMESLPQWKKDDMVRKPRP